MSDFVESVGAATTAALAASALDGDSGQAGAERNRGGCTNCEAPLQGTYCHACGQPARVHRSMLHIVEEFFHGILHFDSKVWRTLPMLIFRPGSLTRDYVRGRRARYVSPLALFLFTVFLMFMTFSFIGTGSPTLPDLTTGPEAARIGASLKEAVADATADLAEAEAELAQALKNGETGEVERGLLDMAKSRRDEAQTALKGFNNITAAVAVEVATQPTASAPAAPVGAPTPSAPVGSDTPEAETSAELTPTNLARILGREAGRGGKITIGHPELDAKLQTALKNPDLLVYKVQNTAYKFSWMLVPISLPFLWLLFFWKRDVVMYDHTIFALYSLSFMSMLFITVSLLFHFTTGLQGPIGSLATIAPPVHMFAQLRGAYGLSVGSALWRTLALLVITLMTSLAFLLFIVTVGMS